MPDISISAPSSRNISAFDFVTSFAPASLPGMTPLFSLTNWPAGLFIAGGCRKAYL
jgi:hypothetical protein